MKVIGKSEDKYLIEASEDEVMLLRFGCKSAVHSSNRGMQHSASNFIRALRTGKSTEFDISGKMVNVLAFLTSCGFGKSSDDYYSVVKKLERATEYLRTVDGFVSAVNSKIERGEYANDEGK